MANLKRLLPIGALLAAGLTPLAGQNPLLTTIAIQSVERAGPPRYLERQVMFSYTTDRPVRLVAARFAHERYQVLHPYFRNENGVFLLLLDIPEGVDALTYRISVDGLWMRDSANPRFFEDEVGMEFSTFDLSGQPARSLASPEVRPNGQVTFWYRARAGRFVSVVGEFNRWDPYWDRMEEASPGLYRATLRLPPGKHFYAFSVDGERLTDPLNVESAEDYEGFRVSTFALYQTRPQ